MWWAEKSIRYPLVARQDLTGAARTWAERYGVGDVLRYSRASKETGIGAGEYARVVNVDGKQNRLTVELSDGRQQSYDPRRQSGVSVYREEQRAFSEGDRIQFTAPANELKVANRELGTVEGIAEGRMALRMDDGRSVQVDSQEHPHLDQRLCRDQPLQSRPDRRTRTRPYRYRAGSQGSAQQPHRLRCRLAWSARCSTVYDDREKLPIALGHEVSRESAHVPEMAKVQAPDIAPKHEHSYGFGISM